MDTNPAQPGGFLPSLPSPSPSTTSSHPANTSTLPHPRVHPLRPGSGKEDTTRRYIETRLLHISRRYTKKFQELDEGGGVTGYTNFMDVGKELGEVVDVLWRSGTRMVPLNSFLALLFPEFLSPINITCEEHRINTTQHHFKSPTSSK